MRLSSAYQWYATFGEYADEAKYIHAPDGSQLCKLNLRTRQVTVLLEDPQGGFRDPRVHYDGGKVLFAYRPSGTHHCHLCEINVNGSGSAFAGSHAAPLDLPEETAPGSSG